MHNQVFEYVAVRRQALTIESWLPASYRAHAAQEDFCYVPGMARAQQNFQDTIAEMSRGRHDARSAVLALILACTFGPIGMLYASELGALVIAIAESVAVLTRAVPLLAAAWACGAVWACAAVVIGNREISDEG